METLILTVIIMALLMTGMAVGVIFRNKPITGSCGGMSALGMDTACDVCGGDPKKCDGESGGTALSADKKTNNTDDHAPSRFHEAR